MRKHTKNFPIPEKFHSLLKYEAIRSGKTITSYMEEIADEMCERNISFREHINEKGKKRFIPRF